MRERGLYVTLSESERDLRLVAKRHGWALDTISVFELVPPEAALDPEKELTLFHPAELESEAKPPSSRAREVEPVRVVFDSLSEMALLAQNSLRYRRQILALKHFFAGRRCTVLLLDDFSSNVGVLHSIAHGVITLQQMAPDYGAERRRLRVQKMRGIRFRGGYHDFIIATGGITIFPRLVAAEHHKAFVGALAGERSCRIRHAARRRLGTWNECSARRGRGSWKIIDCCDLRGGRCAARRAGCHVCVRRGLGHSFRSRVRSQAS